MYKYPHVFDDLDEFVALDLGDGLKKNPEFILEQAKSALYSSDYRFFKNEFLDLAFRDYLLWPIYSLGMMVYDHNYTFKAVDINANYDCAPLKLSNMSSYGEDDCLSYLIACSIDNGGTFDTENKSINIGYNPDHLVVNGFNYNFEFRTSKVFSESISSYWFFFIKSLSESRAKSEIDNDQQSLLVSVLGASNSDLMRQVAYIIKRRGLDVVDSFVHGIKFMSSIRRVPSNVYSQKKYLTNSYDRSLISILARSGCSFYSGAHGGQADSSQWTDWKVFCKLGKIPWKAYKEPGGSLVRSFNQRRIITRRPLKVLICLYGMDKFLSRFRSGIDIKSFHTDYQLVLMKMFSEIKRKKISDTVLVKPYPGKRNPWLVSWLEKKGFCIVEGRTIESMYRSIDSIIMTYPGTPSYNALKNGIPVYHYYMLNHWPRNDESSRRHQEALGEVYFDDPNHLIDAVFYQDHSMRSYRVDLAEKML